MLLKNLGIGILFVLVFLAGNKLLTINSLIQSGEVQTQNDNKDLLFGTNVNEIIAFGKWSADSSSIQKYTYLAKQKYDSRGFRDGLTKFSIFDHNGKEVYQLEMSELKSVFTKSALSKDEQIFLIYNQGGRIQSLKGLAFRNGRIEELIDDPVGKDEIFFEGEVQLIPQYNKNISEPLQILIQDVTGYTSIYRYKDNKHRLYGTYNEKQVQKYTEAIIDIE